MVIARSPSIIKKIQDFTPKSCEYNLFSAIGAIGEKNAQRANGVVSIAHQIWPPQGENFCDMYRDKFVKYHKNSMKSDNVVIAIEHLM